MQLAKYFLNSIHAVSFIQSYCVNYFFRSGLFFTVAFLIVFCLLSYFTIIEYRFLKETFGNRRNAPTKGVVVMSSVFAISFLFRATVNVVIACIPSKIIMMQCLSDFDGSPGWPILVFSLQFFGETLPLSILFYIQDETCAHTRNRSQYTKPESNRNHLFNEQEDNYGTESGAIKTKESTGIINNTTDQSGIMNKHNSQHSDMSNSVIRITEDGADLVSLDSDFDDKNKKKRRAGSYSTENSRFKS